MQMVDKATFLKAAGWTLTGVGLYLLTWGTFLDGDEPAYFEPREPDDSIIDAEWFEVE